MKKLRPEIEFKNKGSMADLFDNEFKAAYNVTDSEYNYICEFANDEELGIMASPESFSEARKALEIRNKYLKLYNEQTAL